MKRCILDCRVWGLGDGAVDADEERLGDDGDEIHDVCVQCALCTGKRRVTAEVQQCGSAHEL